MMRRVWIFRCLLLGFSIVLSLILGEVLVRLVVPQDLSIWDNTRDGITIHRTNADVYLPTYRQRIETNNLGMRDRDRSPTKAPGSTRILLLGDSFLEALQVPFDRSFPALLAERLSMPDLPVETINLAVSGWGTDDELTYLERYGLDLEPDGIVVMMTLHNDLSDNALLEFHTMDRSGLVARPIEPMPWSTFVSQKVKAYLAGVSHLYRLAYHTSVRRSIARGATQLDHQVAKLLRRPGDPEMDARWAFTLALLDEIHALADRRGAWLVVGLIPLAVQVDDFYLTPFLEAHRLTRDDLDLEGPQRRVRDWGERSGVPVVDLLPAFRAEALRGGELLYLPNDGHWTERGHELATQEVARALSRRLGAPTR